MEFTERQILEGRQLFSASCEFMLSVVKMQDLPDRDLPEIAFAGRSNVGKSSLINAVTNRNGLARASNTPGRTQQINFFNLDDRLRIVDLPGYGYAKASKKDITAWNILIRQYLKGRPNLMKVCLLIDSRHGVKENDIEIMKLLDDSAVPYQVVLTKQDKIKIGDVDKLSAATIAKVKKHAAAFPDIHVTSSEKGRGIEELRADLTCYAEAAQEQSS